MSSFGKKLPDSREAKNPSQKEPAKLPITPHSVIGKYEREEMTPRMEAAVKLATILETIVGYLFG